MTYSNPRLKHVKLIKSLCLVQGMSNYDKIKGIVHQCNLLLETKKDNNTKCEDLLRLILPLAKGYSSEHRVGNNQIYVIEAEQYLETKKAKKRKCLHNDTKLVFESGGGYLGEFCKTCKKYVSRPKNNQAPIKGGDSCTLERVKSILPDPKEECKHESGINDAVCWKCGIYFSSLYPKEEMREIEKLEYGDTTTLEVLKLNELIERVNKLSKAL